MIKETYNRLLQIGVEEDTSFAESKKIKLVNEISLLIIIVNLLTVARGIILGQPLMLLINLTGIVVMSVVMYSNKNHYYWLAMLLLFIYLPLHLTFIALLLPIGMEQFIFPIMIIAGLLIEKRKQFLIYLTILGILYIILKGGIFSGYHVPLDENYQNTFYLVSSFLSLVTCFVAINMFVKQYEINRSELLIVNDMLEESVKTAKEKANYAELLLKEMNHRVKNNLQLIASLINIHAQQLSVPEAKKALLDARNRVHTLALIHEKLYLSVQVDSVDIADYMDELVTYLRTFAAEALAGKVTITLHCDHFDLAVKDAVTVGLIINEMVTNALLHGLREVKEKKVQIEVLHTGKHQLQISVQDNGHGIGGVLESKKKGFGLELIETLTSSCQGKLSVNTNTNSLITELQFNN